MENKNLKKIEKTFFISSPVYYPSGKPHIGHAYSTLIVELIGKYKKLLGYDVFILTGTDEHGQKIEGCALESKMSPQAYVDQMITPFQKLWKAMGIEYDFFIRTTEKFHIEACQKVFSKLLEKGFIELGIWKGLYCISCEENYTKSAAIKRDDGQLYCNQDHLLKERKEETYFLKVTLFKDWIKEFLLKNSDFLYPQKRAKELINNFLLQADDFEDLSISRSNFTWGIPIKENPKHVLYVWIDALLNYLTALGYLQKDDRNYQKYWNNPSGQRVHLMSKEITRFHCIYWPIMLKMLEIPLPTKVVSHGWIITKSGKMSKSKGNVLDPFSFVEKYGKDAFRYFLAKEISLKEDSVFSEDLLVSIINTDLANNYGNLINRTLGLLKKYNNNSVPPFDKNTKNKVFLEMIAVAKKAVKTFNELIEDCLIPDLVNKIFEFESKINAFIENTKPWILFKNERFADLNTFLSIITNCIKIMVFYLQPILIDGSKKAIAQLNLNSQIMNYQKILDFSLLDNHQVNDAKVIYLRIDLKAEK